MRSKHILWITLIGLLLATTLPVNIAMAPEETTVYVDPPLTTQTSGDFTVEIKIADVSSAESLYGWECTLKFNPGLLETSRPDVNRGPFLRDAVIPQGYSVYYREEVDMLMGTVKVLEYVYPKMPPDPPYPPVGATGDGTLAVITFHVKAITGVCALDFDRSELYTVFGGNPVPIEHEAIIGVFDSRGGLNDLPQPVFEPSTPVNEGELLTFDGSKSKDDGWIVSYEWDFDFNGTFNVDATGEIAFHAYDVEGMYTAALRVTDGPDGASAIGLQDVEVLVWMEGGTFPDLVQKCAWPEKPKWWETLDGQLAPFHASVGNPTSETYMVYVEFTIQSKDEGKALGTIETEPKTIVAGEILDVTAMLDLTDNKWGCVSGSPEWIPYGYYGAGGMRKYAVFASCYYDDGTGYELGSIVKYFHFNVYPAFHDIGVAMWTDADTVAQGGTLTIYTNMTNKGSLSETFVANVTYKSALAEGMIEQRQVTVPGGENVTQTFLWDTDDLPLGPYIIKVTLPKSTFEYERYTTDQEALTVVTIV